MDGQKRGESRESREKRYERGVKKGEWKGEAEMIGEVRVEREYQRGRWLSREKRGKRRSESVEVRERREGVRREKRYVENGER